MKLKFVKPTHPKHPTSSITLSDCSEEHYDTSNISIMFGLSYLYLDDSDIIIYVLLVDVMFTQYTEHLLYTYGMSNANQSLGN